LSRVRIKAQGECVKGSKQSIKKSTFSHLLLLYLILSCFARLCYFEEKNIQICLTRQGLTPFHVSLHVSCEHILVTPLGTTFMCLIIVGVSLIISDLHRLRRITTNPKDGGARTEVGPHNTITVAMEDLHEVEKIALEKELEEDMVVARRRNLVCFQKTRTGVIKKTVPAITTTTTTAPMVTSNLTPE
jgi:hypothetical protein